METLKKNAIGSLATARDRVAKTRSEFRAKTYSGAVSRLVSRFDVVAAWNVGGSSDARWAFSGS
jgi:hypothetical protein